MAFITKRGTLSSARKEVSKYSDEGIQIASFQILIEIVHNAVNFQPPREIF
jgi:hypothetical protein